MFIKAFNLMQHYFILLVMAFFLHEKVAIKNKKPKTENSIPN
jgi:hypothetical protein